MSSSNVGRFPGVLNQKTGETRFLLARHAPSPDLGSVVLRYWSVTWDLRDQPPHLQETLPHPCVNLVIEKDKSGIFGVVTGKFTNLLSGTGRVFGVKFRPGGFYPFIQTPVSRFTDASIGLCNVFGGDSRELEAAILAQTDDTKKIALVENCLRARLPQPDAYVDLVNRIVDQIVVDRTITRVDDIADRFSLSKRTIQRIFNHYVGVSPKWVIKRYRLHETAEHLADGIIVDWSKLAVDLGYFDQAHFIKDFKTIIGSTPAEYVRRLGYES